MAKEPKKSQNEPQITESGEVKLKLNDPQKYYEVECPSCRAQEGEPCKWEDSSVCYARVIYYDFEQKAKERKHAN